MNRCPICGGDGCRTYPLMVERFLAGRDIEHWRRVHDRLNGPAAPGEAVPPLVPLGESLDLLKKIKSCPHRSRDAGCSCSGMRCALGKGRAGIVNFQDCSACVKGDA